MEFDDPAALERLEAMNPGETDALSFGVVGMEPDGKVVLYNALESQLAGLPAEGVLGQNFFVEVAPCTNNFMIGQRFLDEPTLDETVPYILTVRMRPTPVQLRLLKGRDHKRMYLLVDREG